MAWISVFIVLFYLFMTMYCTPYNALISEFGKTQDDRMYISTAISLTFFAGTMLAYTPFVFAGMLRGSVGFAWSYRICFIILAVISCVCMLIPTFLLKEKDFVDTKPSKSNMFKSLGATFRNGSFRTFVFSDIMYWVGLTLFQTGLPFFVKVSMKLDESFTMIFLGGMTVLSAAFYPIVPKLVKKFGKKKLVITGLLGLFAARTFAMKFGQSLAMLVFTSLAIIGTSQNANSNDITASVLGMTIVGYVAVGFCSLGAIILGMYNEKKVMSTIEKHHKDSK